MARTIRKAKGRAESRGFAGIPRDVMDHASYIGLSASAKALLFDLAFQYRGNNNGDLTCAWAVLKLRGWRSKATIAKARDELLRADLIRRVREGRFLNPGGVCDLFALTWAPLHRDDLDQPPTIRPLRIFAPAAICKTPGPVSGTGSTHFLGRQLAGGAP